MDQELSIIIPAHDSYKDVVLLWCEALNKVWKECPFKIIWANCEEKLFEQNVEVINVGSEVSFAKRLKHGIQYANTKYVLVWVEDYILTNKIDPNELYDLISIMEREECVHTRLFKGSKRGSQLLDERCKLYTCNRNKPYAISINYGLFDASYLLSILQDEWSGWDIERYFLDLSAKYENPKCLYSDKDIGKVVHLVQKGKIIPEAEKKLELLNLDLLKNKREEMTLKECILYNLTTFFSQNTSPKLRKKIKKIVQLFGVKFVTKQ